MWLREGCNKNFLVWIFKKKLLQKRKLLFQAWQGVQITYGHWAWPIICFKWPFNIHGKNEVCRPTFIIENQLKHLIFKLANFCNLAVFDYFFRRVLLRNILNKKMLFHRKTIVKFHLVKMFSFYNFFISYIHSLLTPFSFFQHSFQSTSPPVSFHRYWNWL